MAGSIVKLSVLLSANASQASSTLRQFATDAQAQSMRAKMAFNGQSMRVDVGDGWKQASESGSSLASMTSKVARGFTLASVAAAGYAAVVGVKAAAANEQAVVSFTTLLKSASGAQKMIGDLQQFAASTPFEFAQVREGAQQMLAYGIAARDVLPMMRIIGDAASGSPKGMAQGLESITRAIGQMKGRGKVSSQEMLQLTEAGVNAWEMLAKGIGKSVADTQKLVEDGAVNAATGIKALLEGMQSQFGGNMQAQSQTLLGQWSNLKDNFKLMTGEMAEDLMNVFNVKGMMSSLTDFFGWVRSSWKSMMGKEDMGDSGQRLAKAQKMAAEEMIGKHKLSGNADEFLRADWWKKNVGLAKEMEAAVQKNLTALGTLSKTAVKDLDIVKGAVSPAVKMFQDLRKEFEAEVAEHGLTAEAKKIRDYLKQGGTEEGANTLRQIANQKTLMDERKKMFEDGAKLVEDIRTPYETLSSEMDRFNKMINAGAISWQTYERAVGKANDKFRESEPLTKLMNQTFKELTDRIEKASMSEEQLMQKRISDAGGGFFAQVQASAMQNLALQAEAQRKLHDEADAANKSSLTGLAKYRSELENVKKLWDTGRLSVEARDGMLKKAKDDALNDLKKKNEITSPGLALAGSQEAYKAMVATTQVNPQKGVEEKIERMHQDTVKATNDNTKAVNNAYGELLRLKNNHPVAPPTAHL